MTEELPKRVVVVEDEDTSEEALYVNGVFLKQEMTLYACDIEPAFQGEPCHFAYKTVKHRGSWPERLADLEFIDESETTAAIEETGQ